MKKRPNILFLLTDDQRFDTIRALGNPQISTPNMDRLVARGISFSQATITGGSMSAVCMPSRAMIHTGRQLNHLENHGASIPSEHVLMGEQFRKQGYHTHGTGKWHNGTEAFNRSFCSGGDIFIGGMDDHWNVPLCQYHPDGHYPERPVCVNPWSSRQTRQQAVDYIQPGVHSTDIFAEQAVRFLNEYRKDSPFFLYVSFMAPHDPRTMPSEFLDPYLEDPPDLPANFMPQHPFDNGELKIRDELLECWPRTEQAVQRHLAEYYAMISHADAAIGRIFDALEKNGEMENTLIVLTGDNGLAVGQHGLMGKQNMYDHSLRVPLILAGPGIASNQRSEALVQLSDLFPTLCSLAGLPAPESVETDSFAEATQGGVFEREYTHHAYGAVQRAVRTAQWKLVQHAAPADPVTQLFDLQNDPAELNNLSGHPEAAEMEQTLEFQLNVWREKLDDLQTANGRSFWNGLTTKES